MAKSRKSNATYITERHDILDGEAVVLRTKQSKDVWQFRMRIRGESAYYRESLRIKQFGTAVARAKNKWADITSMVNRWQTLHHKLSPKTSNQNVRSIYPFNRLRSP